VIDAGYFLKRIEPKPDWLQVDGVVEICSVSHCVSPAPEGWVTHWHHNGLGWFNRVSDVKRVVPTDSDVLYRLFAYRLYPEMFRDLRRVRITVPDDVHPDPIPSQFETLGFDAVSKSLESILGFECSPLSCNAMALECEVNTYCLCPSLEKAIAAATRFAVEQPEPGDYYVVEVLEDRATSPSLSTASDS